MPPVRHFLRRASILGSQSPESLSCGLQTLDTRVRAWCCRGPGCSSQSADDSSVEFDWRYRCLFLRQFGTIAGEAEADGRGEEKECIIGVLDQTRLGGT